MNGIKITTGHHLNDSFSSVKYNDLWDILVKYIKDNTSSLAGIKYIEKDGIVKVNYRNEKQFLSIINKVDPNSILKHNIIRIMKLNTKFDKSIKDLIISNENVEDFSDFNEIFYSLTCNNKIKGKNSLFYHPSSLVDYTIDKDINDVMTSKYKLACIFYDVKISMLDELNNVTNIETNEIAFLCYDTTTKKLTNDTFIDSINENKSIDLKKFISCYNNNESYDSILDKAEENNSCKKISQFDNIRFSISQFSLVDKKIDNFINFKSFMNLQIYNSFIDSLDKNSVKII